MIMRIIFALAAMLLPSLLWAGTMQIEAEKMIFFHKENKAEFTGNVQVKRDDFIMNCDRLVVNYSKGETLRWNLLMPLVMSP